MLTVLLSRKQDARGTFDPQRTESTDLNLWVSQLELGGFQLWDVVNCFQNFIFTQRSLGSVWQED